MYIDPNTGGVLFQALAGLLAVFSTALLVFSKNIRQFFFPACAAAPAGMKTTKNKRPPHENTHPWV